MAPIVALLIAGALLGLAPQSMNSPKPTLVVQLVDPGWTPVPRVKVQVTPAKTCKPKAGRSGPPVFAETDQEGFARFNVPDNSSYILQVSKESGFLPTPKCVRIFRRASALPTAYVQMQVRDRPIVIQ
jgi:hypothetical protein